MLQNWAHAARQLPQNDWLLARRKGPYYLRHCGLKLGLVPGQRRYNRFVIVCLPRTGSSMLRSLLNSHRQVIAFGELFNSDTPMNWALAGYSKRGPAARLHRRDPVLFLKRAVYGCYPRGIGAVGFKLIYDQAREDGRRHLWRYLQTDRDIGIVHLIRRNILRSYLSLQVARKFDHWIRIRGRPHGGHRLRLEGGQTVAALAQMASQIAAMRSFFDPGRTIEVFYEDLCRQREAQLRRIQSFLGVAELDLRPALHKLPCVPLSRAIANYTELRQALRGSPWEPFLEE